MPASIGTLNALTLAKVANTLGTYQTVAASALATTTLVTPQALYVTVASADDIIDAFFQVMRLTEAYPNLLTHVIMSFESDKLADLATECSFGSYRIAFAPNSLVLVYVANISNALNTFRNEFPNGYVKG